MSSDLRIDVWSDIACPWCYVGKRRLEAALEKFAHRSAVTVRWRAFELDPSAPAERDPQVGYAERLAKKYGSSAREAEGMIQRMTDTAAADGLDFRFDRIRSGSTFDAHRVIHFAAAHGKQDAVKERLLRAYMTEGEIMSDHETLVRLAAEAGLDPEQVRAMLASDAEKKAVHEDEDEARQLGISGVPFFVIGGKYAVSGAQPAELLLRALEKAWDDVTERPRPFGEGAACGPEGCA
ncbi:MAG: 2-hydroxychromene-2-carboxylate isomerase/DsbA-like thioredoxin domain protein [Labilithrix sp.]|nr:2-hydroxychromene-2-carboxylate isomerase/DsbA-like thioredoxin domain protein [Labilithrix sp.]